MCYLSFWLSSHPSSHSLPLPAFPILIASLFDLLDPLSLAWLDTLSHPLLHNVLFLWISVSHVELFHHNTSIVIGQSEGLNRAGRNATPCSRV